MNNTLSEEQYEQLQIEAKDLFNQTFSSDYLEHLSNKSTTKQDLVELLWSGFVQGYIQSSKNNQSKKHLKTNK